MSHVNVSISGSRLDRLTSLRFFAALLVLGNHSTRDLTYVPHASELLTSGTVGVTFFFALSGFVLTWSHREGDTPVAFTRRRFARVFPVHFVTWILAFPILLVVGDTITGGEAIANLFLVQSWNGDPHVYFGMNAVSWSLSAEVFFYLVFPFCLPLLLRTPRWALRGLLAVLVAGNLIAASQLSAALSPETNRYVFYILPAYGLVSFLSGAVLARLMRTGLLVDVPVWAAGLLAACGYVLAHFDSHRLGGIGHGIENAVFLPFILILIGAAATADLRQQPGFLTHPVALKLGEWSFALYMTHWLLLQALTAALPDLDDLGIGVRVLVQVAFAVVAVALSALVYTVVERPLERRFRGGRPRSEMAVATQH